MYLHPQNLEMNPYHFYGFVLNPATAAGKGKQMPPLFIEGQKIKLLFPTIVADVVWLATRTGGSQIALERKDISK